MKKGTRLYINVTNNCNYKCPFCCMYCGPDKNRFMTLDQYRKIIDDCQTDFEVQLEGGEPFQHRDIEMFVEYAISQERCKKVIILTNGNMLIYMRKLQRLANRYDTKIEFKVSVNYSLIGEAMNHGCNKFLWYKKLSERVDTMPNISMIFNVRKRHIGDEWIEGELEKYGLKEKSNIYFFQSYGRLKNHQEYDQPVIVQNIDDWRIYASDGTCFGQDLIARSEYEK